MLGKLRWIGPVMLIVSMSTGCRLCERWYEREHEPPRYPYYGYGQGCGCPPGCAPAQPACPPGCAPAGGYGTGYAPPPAYYPPSPCGW